MLVKEIMTHDVVTVDADASVLEACLLYMKKKVGCLVVVSAEECVGIVTERDLIERGVCLGRDPRSTRVRAIMSSQIKTVHALDTTEQALQVMRQYHIKKLPVIVDDRVVGIVTLTDIAQASDDLSRRFMESWIKPRWRD